MTPETLTKINRQRLRRDPDAQYRRHQRAIGAATYHATRRVARVALHRLTGVQK